MTFKRSYQQVFILALFWVLTGCVDLGFYEVQPPNSESIEELPEYFHGTYIAKEDTISISSTVIVSGRDSTSVQPSENLKLQKWNDYIFINSKEHNQNYWVVFALKHKKSKLELYLPDVEPDDQEKLSRKYEIETVKGEDGKIKAFIMNPPPSNWAKLLKSKYYEKTTLKKIIIPSH